MRWAVLALCAGCNNVWGLDATHLADAEITVMQCPSPGTPPVFSKIVVQRLAQGCEELSLGGDRAVARCTGDYGLSEGAFDGTPLARIANTDDLSAPRMSPDGATIFAREPAGVVQLSRDAGGWTRTTLPISITDDQAYLTEPTSTSPRHALLVDGDQVHEYVEAAGTWVERPPAMSASAFGAGSVRGAHLSPDGLRLLAIAWTTGFETFVMYADRPTLDDAFTTRRLEVPTAYDFPFLTHDCARLYFSSLGFVLSVEQRQP